MNKHTFILKSLLTFLALFVFNTLSYAQVYVDIDATGAGDGSTWTDAYTDLKAAIDATSSGEIWVAEGTYKPDVSSPGDRDLSFSMKINVAIYGGFEGTETMLSQRDPVANVTILNGDLNGDDVVTGSGATLSITMNGDNSYHVVDNSANNLDNTAVLDGLTISGGNADGVSSNSGGGMNNGGSSPTITNCTFANNSANSAGGGIYNSNGSNPSISNCTFANNAATLFGGGMYNIFCTPTLTNCNLSGNSANQGGGLFGFTSSPTLSLCVFSDNFASNNGGGMYNENGGNPGLTICTFSNNSASSLGGGMFNNNGSGPTLNDCVFSENSTLVGGGGMFNQNSSNPTMINSTFSKNSAPSGGGMYNDAISSPTLTNCTFSENTASSSGGGMFNRDNSSPTLTNCILWGNGNGSNFFNNTDAIVTHSIVEGASVYAGTENSNSDPLYVDASDPDGADNIPGTADDGISIFIGSPADGKADGTSAPATDITGAARTAPHDMGAYVAISVTPQAFKIGLDTYATLQEAITALNSTAGEIEQLLDFTEATLIMIPSYVTLVIPANKTLTFNTNSISSGGIISNNGTLVVDTFTNDGTYKGSGTCQGNFVNNGTIEIGG